jgi:hypothetical protein
MNISMTTRQGVPVEEELADLVDAEIARHIKEVPPEGELSESFTFNCKQEIRSKVIGALAYRMAEDAVTK